MIKRDELTNFIYQTLGEDFLVKAANIDELPNRVQIRGTDQVSKISLGVSCSEQFIQESIKRQAQYLLVHHGLATNKLIVKGRFDFIESRIKAIVKNDLTLAGFHYALDAHPQLGNNAQVIKLLGAKRLEEPYFEAWGWIGEFNQAISLTELKSRAKDLFNHDIYTVPSGPKMIKRIGVCSGGARPREGELFEIIDHRLDLHLTGEIAEGDLHQAIAGEYHYLACGHYATETFGVKALGEVIKNHFGDQLAVEFIDIPTSL